jgi:hypothetical protein
MDINTTLLIINLVLTFLMTVITSTKLRCKCCGGSLDFRPKDSASPPASPPQVVVTQPTPALPTA